MNSKYKDKLVGVYAPGNYGHTSVLDQTHCTAYEVSSIAILRCTRWKWWNVMNELDYVKSMFDKYVSECKNLSKEPPNAWTTSAANKSKIKRLGIELRQEMIDLERKYYV